jgi:hypothetical protein
VHLTRIILQLIMSLEYVHLGWASIYLQLPRHTSSSFIPGCYSLSRWNLQDRICSSPSCLLSGTKIIDVPAQNMYAPFSTVVSTTMPVCDGSLPGKYSPCTDIALMVCGNHAYTIASAFRLSVSYWASSCLQIFLQYATSSTTPNATPDDASPAQTRASIPSNSNSICFRSRPVR